MVKMGVKEQNLRPKHSDKFPMPVDPFIYHLIALSDKVHRKISQALFFNYRFFTSIPIIQKFVNVIDCHVL